MALKDKSNASDSKADRKKPYGKTGEVHTLDIKPGADYKVDPENPVSEDAVLSREEAANEQDPERENSF